MRKRITSLLLGVLLLLTMTVTAFAAEGQAGSFVFTAMNANSTIVEPTRVPYKAGQTIQEALAASDIKFVGLEQGFIYEINGVSANYLTIMTRAATSWMHRRPLSPRSASMSAAFTLTMPSSSSTVWRTIWI